MSLLALWSPKGGAGTSVVAAACSLLLARSGETRLADLAGDQPAVLGLGDDPVTGLSDWLALGAAAPAGALDRIARAVAHDLTLLPLGAPVPEGDAPTPEAGAALATILREGPPTVADLGAAREPAARALLEVADAAILVTRPCYLSLRRAVRLEATRRSAGVVLVEEPGRALGVREVADVLGRPVVGRVPVRDTIARAVDAGVLVTRMPEPLERVAADALRAVGLRPGRTGAAA